MTRTFTCTTQKPSTTSIKVIIIIVLSAAMTVYLQPQHLQQMRGQFIAAHVAYPGCHALSIKQLNPLFCVFALASGGDG